MVYLFFLTFFTFFKSFFELCEFNFYFLYLLILVLQDRGQTQRRSSIMIPTPKLSPGCSRIVPLPNFSWASAKDVWSALLQREQRYGRNPLMMSRHPSLQPRMRSILLNWLSEVSEVYQLHRETYYLAVDFFDRYLSVQSNIPKQQLQLIGVTCLFMASKMEEIYPPKVKDFAYVTDGACTVEQIITKELVILRCLKWKLSSLTVNSWLTIYMQLYAVLEKEPRSDRLPVATPSSPTSTTTVTASSEDVVESSSCKLDKATSSAGDKDELNAESIDKFAASAPPKKRKRIVLNNSTQLDANENNVTAGSTSASTQINSTSNNTCSNTAEVLIDKSNAKSESSSVQSDASIDSAVHSVTTTTGTTRRCTKKDFISSILGRESEEAGEKFMRQRFSPYFFAQVAHLLDLSMLDIGSLRFSYNVISAAALYHFTNLNTVLQCTGMRLNVFFYFT